MIVLLTVAAIFNAYMTRAVVIWEGSNWQVCGGGPGNMIPQRYGKSEAGRNFLHYFRFCSSSLATRDFMNLRGTKHLQKCIWAEKWGSGNASRKIDFQILQRIWRQELLEATELSEHRDAFQREMVKGMKQQKQQWHVSVGRNCFRPGIKRDETVRLAPS